ncbi:MAG: hypothetical protein AAF554_08270 [Bacteroidota bacterium]
MKNKGKVLNGISIVLLVLLVVAMVLIITDNPLSWKLFPDGTALQMPILLLIPVVLSIVSLRVKKNVWTRVILVISILLFLITGLFALYIIALASAFQY